MLDYAAGRTGGDNEMLRQLLAPLCLYLPLTTGGALALDCPTADGREAMALSGNLNEGEACPAEFGALIYWRDGGYAASEQGN
jgi:hypothetical protein